MIMRLGIGIATYNRRDLVLATAARVMAHTLHPYTMMVADDGSRDGTVAALRAQRLTVVEGANRGVAWNKNRILFYLMELARCDIVIMLEDDTFPARDGWERDWIVAAARHGLVHLATAGTQSGAVDGAGTGEAPFLTPAVVSHCSALSREATQFGGYFNVVLTGCGYENVEYAQRMLRYGYGGEMRQLDGRRIGCHYAVKGGVTVTTPPSYVTTAGIARNRAIAQAQAQVDTPRACWRDRVGMEQFRSEMATAFPRIRRQMPAAFDTVADASTGADASTATMNPADLSTAGIMPPDELDAVLEPSGKRARRSRLSIR